MSEFLTEAFSYADLDWRDYVEMDPKYLRPSEVELLVGDASKARNTLGWEPKVTFTDLVHLMVDADMSLVAANEQHEVFGDVQKIGTGA